MELENYNKTMRRAFDLLGDEKPTMLLHCCCACCATSVIEILDKFFSLTLFYYNPNTYPYSEYEKRLSVIYDYLSKSGLNLPVIAAEYNPSEYDCAVSTFEDASEGSLRCKACMSLRLDKTAELAKNNGFDYFVSTLSVSPLKNADWLNEIGRKLEDKYKTKYLVNDFKKEDGYKRSVELSKQFALYRQNYCGCKASLEKSMEKKNG